METVYLDEKDMGYVQKFLKKLEQMEYVELDEDKATDQAHIRQAFAKALDVPGATPRAREYFEQNYDNWAEGMAKQNREEAEEARRKAPPEDEHKNRNYYKLPERTEFFGRRRDHYGFAGDDSAIIASKNNGIAGRGDNQSKIYWNPNAVASNGKKGAYFYQKPVVEITTNTIADDVITQTSTNMDTQTNTFSISFTANSSTYPSGNVQNQVVQIGRNNNINTTTRRNMGSPRIVQNYRQVSEDDNEFGLKTIVEEEELRQYVETTTVNVSITISLQTSCTQTGIVLGTSITGATLLNQRFQQVFQDLSNGGFPRSNIRRGNFQFGVPSGDLTRNNSVSISILRTTTIIKGYTTIRNQRIKTWKW